ncbi:MAG: SGNH/GDSL hydrolase family protein [Eubacteriales bacterium]|nr:SGNH/GDSL hydrolase family protein [Eubacteriales bacterium]
MMKTVMCYGDSNTWGQRSDAEERYDYDVRWTGRLQKLLGDDYRIIEQGINGRTTAYDLPLEDYRNGWKALPMVLSCVDPIDLVVIMLGTNDRRTQLCVSPQESAIALERYIHMIRTPPMWFGHQVPKILLVAPPEIDSGVTDTEFGFYYDQKSVDDSKKLKDAYSALAKKYDCDFLDVAPFTKTGVDCVHLDAESHAAMAEKMAEKIRSIF